jgi:hypothetical protein
MDSVISAGLSIPATPNTVPKVLNQRNALLKYFALNRVFENDTLLYNEQLDVWKHIEKKEKFISQFIPIFNITMRSPDRKKRFK